MAQIPLEDKGSELQQSQSQLQQNDRKQKKSAPEQYRDRLEKARKERRAKMKREQERLKSFVNNTAPPPPPSILQYRPPKKVSPPRFRLKNLEQILQQKIQQHAQQMAPSIAVSAPTPSNSNNNNNNNSINALQPPDATNFVSTQRNNNTDRSMRRSSFSSYSSRSHDSPKKDIVEPINLAAYSSKAMFPSLKLPYKKVLEKHKQQLQQQQHKAMMSEMNKPEMASAAPLETSDGESPAASTRRIATADPYEGSRTQRSLLTAATTTTTRTHASLADTATTIAGASPRSHHHHHHHSRHHKDERQRKIQTMYERAQERRRFATQKIIRDMAPVGGNYPDQGDLNKYLPPWMRKQRRNRSASAPGNNNNNNNGNTSANTKGSGDQDGSKSAFFMTDVFDDDDNNNNNINENNANNSRQGGRSNYLPSAESGETNSYYYGDDSYDTEGSDDSHGEADEQDDDEDHSVGLPSVSPPAGKRKTAMFSDDFDYISDDGHNNSSSNCTQQLQRGSTAPPPQRTPWYKPETPLWRRRNISEESKWLRKKEMSRSLHGVLPPPEEFKEEIRAIRRERERRTRRRRQMGGIAEFQTTSTTASKHALLDQEDLQFNFARAFGNSTSMPNLKDTSSASHFRLEFNRLPHNMSNQYQQSHQFHNQFLQLEVPPEHQPPQHAQPEHIQRLQQQPSQNKGVENAATTASNQLHNKDSFITVYKAKSWV